MLNDIRSFIKYNDLSFRTCLKTGFVVLVDPSPSYQGKPIAIRNWQDTTVNETARLAVVWGAE